MMLLMGITAAFLLGAGLFLTVYLRFGRVLPSVLRRGRRAGRERRDAGGKRVSPLGGLCMALAGTLGVGNIAGVASALWLGGPGSAVWMIFSGLAVSVLKYAEIVLAVRHRRTAPDGTRTGGAPYYMRDILLSGGHGRAARLLPAVFSGLCIACSLTMGSLLQVNAAAGALGGAFGVPRLAAGAVMAVLSVLLMTGGARRIAAFTEKLVPVMTLVYVGLCAAVLVSRHERLPGAVSLMLREAFSLRSAGAGVLGYGIARAARVGTVRGLVSNEAGAGTAPMAHAAADTDSPAAQGLLGVAEVLVDTVLLCTLTALTVLVSDSGFTAFGDDGVTIARAAFTGVLGEGAGAAFAVSLTLFAAATVFCWSHYGLTCVDSLTVRCGDTGRRRARAVFTAAFCASQLLGALTAPAAAWAVSDAAVCVMTLLNLVFLLAGRQEVRSETYNNEEI